MYMLAIETTGPNASVALFHAENPDGDLLRMENTTFELQGRHDPAIFHRARPVVDAVTAMVLADLLTARFGTDYLRTGGSADGQVAAAEVGKLQSIAKTGETL